MTRIYIEEVFRLVAIAMVSSTVYLGFAMVRGAL